MKKTLSLLVVLTMLVSLLTVSVFAVDAAGQDKVIENPEAEEAPSAEYYEIFGEVEGTEITSVTTNAPADVDIGVGPADGDFESAEAAAEAANTEMLEKLNGFKITVSEDGDYNVNVRMRIPRQFMGNFLTVLVDSEVYASNEITGPVMTLSFDKFGVVTPVITADEVPVAESPTTGDNFLTVAIAAVALFAMGGVVLSRKRLYN